MKATHETTKVASEFDGIKSEIEGLPPTNIHALLRTRPIDATISTHSDLMYATPCSTRLFPTPYIQLFNPNTKHRGHLCGPL